MRIRFWIPLEKFTPLYSPGGQNTKGYDDKEYSRTEEKKYDNGKLFTNFEQIWFIKPNM